jgi:hypothetical protein
MVETECPGAIHCVGKLCDIDVRQGCVEIHSAQKISVSGSSLCVPAPYRISYHAQQHRVHSPLCAVQYLSEHGRSKVMHEQCSAVAAEIATA